MSELQTESFEVFAAGFNGANSRVTLTGREKAPWRYRQVQLGDVAVHVADEGAPNLNEGSLWPGIACVFIPLTAPHLVNLNGRRFDGQTVAVVGPGHAIASAATDCNSWATVVLPLSEIEHTLDADDTLLRAWLRGTALVRSTRERYRRLARTARRIVDAHAASGDLQPAAAEALRDEVIETLAGVLKANGESSTRRRGRPRIARGATIGRVSDYLWSRRTEVVKVGDLVSAAGVSERTLRAILMDEYGMGPHRYLELVRLHRLREALQQADPASASVRERAMAAGVSDAKTLARRYRRLFGENPSETLKLKRR